MKRKIQVRGLTVCVFWRKEKVEDSAAVTLEPSTFRITFAGSSRQCYAIFSFSFLLVSSLRLFSSLPLFVVSI
jgi:hypothetical protein